LNSLSSLVEAFAKLIGKGTGVREAFNDRKISDTTEEVHDRSEVLTGAAYKIFLAIYDGLKPELGAEEALRQAGQIMGFFLTRVADYTPENQLTLEDVAKAYLKVDKEFFDYRYHNLLVDEFRRREIFDADSEREWLAHEAATPKLWLHPQWQEDKVEQIVLGNLDKLGVGPDFGLKVQSVNRIEPFGHVKERGPSRRPMQTIVRVQLTYGRGEGAQTLHNHGILVFNASGMLAEYHAPLTPDYFAPQLMDVFAQAQALSLLGHAAQLRLDQRGAPLSIVRKADGQLTVESRVMRGEGLNTYMEVFTLDNPRGERREIVVPPLPPDKRILISDDLLK
jgi:hypothetical protein